MKQYMLFFLLLAVAACNNTQQASEQTGDSSATAPLNASPALSTTAVIDTAAVVAAFGLLKNDSLFLDKLDLLSESTYDIYDEERPVLIGDINKDQLPDALMPFSIEGLGGGNNYTVFYAVMLNREGKLQCDTVLFRGSKMSENMLSFTAITNGAIEGWELPGFHHPDADSIYVQYQFRNGKLAETVREN